MKKLVALSLSLLMIATLSACSATAKTTNPSKNTDTTKKAEIYHVHISFDNIEKCIESDNVWKDSNYIYFMINEEKHYISRDHAIVSHGECIICDEIKSNTQQLSH